MIVGLRDEEMSAMSYDTIDDYHRMALVVELEASRNPRHEPDETTRIIAAIAVSSTIEQGEVK